MWLDLCENTMGYEINTYLHHGLHDFYFDQKADHVTHLRHIYEKTHNKYIEKQRLFGESQPKVHAGKNANGLTFFFLNN